MVIVQLYVYVQYAQYYKYTHIHIYIYTYTYIYMKISKYISIPTSPQYSSYSNNNYYHKESHHTPIKYISYVQIMVSLLSGLLLICFRVINLRVVRGKTGSISQFISITQNTIQLNSAVAIDSNTSAQQYQQQQLPEYNNFDIIYTFGFTLLFKLAIVLNYWWRKKERKLGHLQKMAKITVLDLTIPAFLKSIFYISMMISTMYIHSYFFTIMLLLAVVGIELLNWLRFQRGRLLIPRTLLNKQQNSSQQLSSYIIDSRYIFSFRDMFSQLCLLLSIALTAYQLTKISTVSIQLDIQSTLSIQSGITMILVSVVCMLAYYYLHSRLFQLYELDVDEIICKQYFVQLLNFMIISATYYVYMTNLVVSDASSINQDQQVSITVKDKFLFILEYPIHTLVGCTMSIIYEYLIFEMLKKHNPKYLLLAQISGVLWFNLYIGVKNYEHFIQNGMALLLFGVIVVFGCVGFMGILPIFSMTRLAQKIYRLFRKYEKSSHTRHTHNSSKLHSTQQQHKGRRASIEQYQKHSNQKNVHKNMHKNDRMV